LANIEPKTTL